jgi:ribosome assembly protein 1
MFVDFILKNIWSIYGAIVMKPNKEKVEKIIGLLSLEVPKRDLDNKDAKVVVKAVFSR